MSALLITVCCISTLLTVFTLIESIHDFRAVRRLNQNQVVKDLTTHGTFIEILRVMKVLILSFGASVAFILESLDTIIFIRNVVIVIVISLIGLTSLLDLGFRHRTMRLLKAEYQKKLA